VGAENSEFQLSSRRLHSSWLLSASAAGIILGVILARFWLPEFSAIAWVLLVIVFAVAGFIINHQSAVVCLLLAGMILGIGRASLVLERNYQIKEFVGSTVKIKGFIREDPALDIDGKQKIRIETSTVEGRQLTSIVWVSLNNQQSLRREDTVVVSGVLQKGFGTIPVSLYRADLLEISRGSSPALDVRDSFASSIRRSVDEPEASLGSGFLLGLKQQLPEELDRDLQLLSLTHIVVASGYNLTILIRFARRLFMKISRFSALFVSLLFLYGFVQMTGFSPSMSRASLIASLSLLAWYFGRVFHPVVLLLFTAGVTVLVNPAYAWGDLGWLLSFLSFIGVILYAPMIHAYFWGDIKPKFFRQLFVETVSAQALALPVTVFVFGQYSILSIIANIAVVPLIPYAMFATFLAGLGGYVSPLIATISGFPAELLLRYMTIVIEYIARQPAAESEFVLSPGGLVAAYILLVAIGVFLKRKTAYSFKNYNIIE
jgi:competence protein ComEC